jgi:hypothetical protein
MLRRLRSALDELSVDWGVHVQLGAILSSALGIPPMVAGLTVLCTGLALYEPICEIVGGKVAPSAMPNVAFI